MLKHCNENTMDVGKAIFLSYIDGRERVGQCPDTKLLFNVKQRPPNWGYCKPIKVIGEFNA